VLFRSKKWRQPLIDGYRRAVKFLRQESFFSPRDLPYRTQLIPLAAVMAIIGDRWLEHQTYNKIARWFWCGVLGEMYGGSVETRMAMDIQELIDWINGSNQELSTIRDANFQPERLETLYTRNSAAYKGINILIQREGAQDFFWRIAIKELDENDWEERQLEIHHIFPKSWCKNNGIPSSRYDSILNKTPISYKANKMIGGKAPSEYLAQLQNHSSVQLDDAGMNAILATHCIDATTLRQDDFEDFMTSRQLMIISKIEAAMGKPVLRSDNSGLSDLAEEE